MGRGLFLGYGPKIRGTVVGKRAREKSGGVQESKTKPGFSIKKTMPVNRCKKRIRSDKVPQPVLE